MTHPGCCPLMTRLVDLRIAGFLKLVTSARVAWSSSALWQRVLRRRGTGFALHSHPERGDSASIRASFDSPEAQCGFAAEVLGCGHYDS